VLTTGLSDDLQHRKVEESIEKTLSFCSRYNLPTELRRAVVTHIRYFNDYNYIFENEKIMEQLPNHLQIEIEKHLKRTRLRKLNIFKDLPTSITGQIALRMTAKSCGAGKPLFRQGDIGKELFIQRTGTSNLIAAMSSRPIQRGDVIATHSTRRCHWLYTVRCETWSEFYVLKVRDIEEVLRANYGEHEAQQKWVRIKHMIHDSMPSHTRGGTFQMSEEHHTIAESKCSRNLFVKFDTIRECADFEEYVPAEDRTTPECRDVLKVSPTKMKQYEEYERKVLEEAEEEEALERQTSDKHKSMAHILKLFGNQREQSHVRNEKVVRNHKRGVKKSSTYFSPEDGASTHYQHEVVPTKGDESFEDDDEISQDTQLTQTEAEVELTHPERYSNLVLQCLDLKNLDECDDEMNEDSETTNEDEVVMNPNPNTPVSTHKEDIDADDKRDGRGPYEE